MEAQGAGGAAGAEAEKQARNLELRAKLKDRKELLRNAELQALVIVIVSMFLASVHPASMSGLGAVQHCEKVLGVARGAPPLRRTTSTTYLPLIASMQALDSIEDKARALQGKGKAEQGKGTAAKRKEIEDAVLTAQRFRAH